MPSCQFRSWNFEHQSFQSETSDCFQAWYLLNRYAEFNPAMTSATLDPTCIIEITGDATEEEYSEENMKNNAGGQHDRTTFCGEPFAGPKDFKDSMSSYLTAMKFFGLNFDYGSDQKITHVAADGVRRCEQAGMQRCSPGKQFCSKHWRIMEQICIANYARCAKWFWSCVDFANMKIEDTRPGRICPAKLYQTVNTK